MLAVYLTANPALHARTKHFDVDFHYVRERVAHGALIVKHIPASQQLAYMFTKSLPQKPYFDLRFKVGVSLPPATSLREYVNKCYSVSESLHQQEARLLKTRQRLQSNKSVCLLQPKRCV